MADQTKKQEATLRDFLNVVFRRKWVILSILLLTTVSVVYFNARKPLTFVSSARVLVERGEQGSVFHGTRYLPWAEEVSSEIEVILSKPVFERARTIFADSVTARTLDREISFQPRSVRADVVGESNVFVIVSAGLDPLECQFTCDAVTHAYKEYYEDKARPREVEDFFSEEIEDVAVEIEAWRQRKADFLNQTKFFGVDHEGRSGMTRKTNAEITLTEVRADVSQQGIKVESLRRLTLMSAEEAEKQLAVSEGLHMMQSTLIQNIKFSLQRLRIEREELLKRYTPKHPEVEGVDAQIAELLVNLKREVQNAYSIEESRLTQLLARQAMLESELESINERLAKLPDQELELDRIESKIAALERERDMLIRRFNEAEIAEAASQEFEVTILSPAGIATPRKTTDYVRLALAPLLALIVGLGFAFFLEGLDHSLKNDGEVEQFLGTQVLATVSDIQEKVS